MISLRYLMCTPPRLGVLLYGPPGTGKTLLARACAAQTKSTFLKLAGPQLVQMFIGDGAKLVRDAFALAKEKAPAIIFIDEVDAIGIYILPSRLVCFNSYISHTIPHKLVYVLSYLRRRLINIAII